MSGTKINAFCKLRTAARAAVCLLFLFFCAGCAGEDTKSILEYQTALQSCLMEEEAAGTLFARMWEIVPRPDGFTVRLCPEGERGDITFFLTESGASASAGGITLPVSDAMSRAARSLGCSFPFPCPKGWRCSFYFSNSNGARS